MKQVLQSLKTGATEVADVPCPSVKPGHVLIRTRRTLVSPGTERMLVEFGKASLLEKARQQPEKVRMVLDKIRTDGLVPTIEAVLDKLDQPLPMGYCNVGTVVEVGERVSGLAAGDRVASNGAHAEVVSVPANLCARVPAGVGDEDAAFTVIGAIALQGIRLAKPTLGESVVVTGLGLVGLMTVQLLRAHGCRVLGLDFDERRLALARSFGAEVVNLAAGEDPVAAAWTFSRCRGMDAAVITASTKSSEPVHQAALMCRKRGRIVLVGVTGLELSRADFYEKELTFQVSCSYGPGRYDPAYEEGGKDYPAGFVRWTEQRNFEAVLDMMAAGALDVRGLISHRLPLIAASKAYELIASGESVLGVLLGYEADSSATAAIAKTVRLHSSAPSDVAGKPPKVAFIGTGNYATKVLIPAFKKSGAGLAAAASSGGVGSFHAARKHGLDEATTDTNRLLGDASIDAIVISTRHDSHARLVCEGLRAGKHVFVEKPLALRLEELAEIEATYAAIDGRKPVLMAGFNRRFSPHAKKAKELLAAVTGPKAFVMTVNAGRVPEDHWTQDREAGGGRIVGEACHFLDLLRFLAGSPISGAGATHMESARSDTASIHLEFEDGSIGTVHYLANGSRSFPKERLEIFARGRILVLDNFRSLSGYDWPGFRRLRSWRQDKGQRACAASFVRAIERGEPAPISFEELMEVSRVALQVSGSGR